MTGRSTSIARMNEASMAEGLKRKRGNSADSMASMSLDGQVEKDLKDVSGQGEEKSVKKRSKLNDSQKSESVYVRMTEQEVLDYLTFTRSR